MLSKLGAAILLIQRALSAKIKADYILMDSWFTAEPMIQSILVKGLNVIGIVKQVYICHEKLYTLSELQKFVYFERVQNIFGSLCITTRNGIPVKVIFVRNRNKKNECLYLLNANLGLSDSEIVQIYGNQ